MTLPLDHSQTSCFLQCPERYHQKYVNQLRKLKEGVYDQPRLFGQAIHNGLEAYYLGQSPQAITDCFLAVYPKAPDPSEAVLLPEHGISALTRYQAWAKQQDKDWKVLSVEVVDQFELAPGYPYLVKIDLIIETPMGILFVDHKTTQKYLGEDYWRSFDPNGQLTGYAAYCFQKYGQCSGGYINAISLGVRKRASPKGPAGFWVEFQRQIFNRTQEQIEDWKLRIMRTMDRLKATKESGLWEKNESLCVWCEFNQLCVSVDNPGVREVLYESHDPYEYLKERVETGGQI
jgi:hypothetical protein